MPDGRGQYGRKTLSEIQKEHPGALEVDADQWIADKEKYLTQDPAVSITEEKFLEMLECLPPQNWQMGPGAESFELMEHTSGRVTSIYVRHENRFWEITGIAGSSLESNLVRCGVDLQIAKGITNKRRQVTSPWQPFR